MLFTTLRQHDFVFEIVKIEVYPKYFRALTENAEWIEWGNVPNNIVYCNKIIIFILNIW